MLEDLLDEIYAAETPAAPPPPSVAAVREVVRVPVLKNKVQAPIIEPSLAERVFDWCKAAPTPEGIYSTSAAARVLMPTDPRGSSKIYTAVIRNSPQSDREVAKPRFFWLGDAKFRLFTKEDRLQSQHA